MDARAFWNQRYGQPGYGYGTAPNVFLASVAHYLPPGAQVLCLGEGEGRNGCFLAGLGHHVTGLDLASAGRDKALALAAERGVTLDYVVTDVNDYDFGQARWDAIVSIYAHTDPITRARTLEQSRLALKPGGLFILLAYHPRQILDGYDSGGPGHVDWLVALDDVHGRFAGFEILHADETGIEQAEGTRHVGTAFVTRFVGRKPPPEC